MCCFPQVIWKVILQLSVRSLISRRFNVKNFLQLLSFYDTLFQPENRLPVAVGESERTWQTDGVDHMYLLTSFCEWISNTSTIDDLRYILNINSGTFLELGSSTVWFTVPRYYLSNGALSCRKGQDDGHALGCPGFDFHKIHMSHCWRVKGIRSKWLSR